jgi:hypothetical protein
MAMCNVYNFTFTKNALNKQPCLTKKFAILLLNMDLDYNFSCKRSDKIYEYVCN